MHGSAFEFLRNTALDARNYFSAGSRGLSAKSVWRNAGRRAVSHKSVALFADYQGTRLTEGIDTGDIAVPSMAERGGDFSQNPLTGSVNGDILGGACCRRAWAGR